MTPQIADAYELEQPYRARWHALAFAIERSKRYYALRRQWFQRWGLAVNLATALSGSAGVMNAFGADGAVAKGLVGLAVVLGVTSLVLRFHHRAYEYQRLLDRTVLLEERMIKGPPTPELLHSMELEREKIGGDYGAERGVLNVLCHNDVLQSWGYTSATPVPVTWWQRALKQFLTDYRLV